MARRAAPFNIRPRNGYAQFDATIRGHRHREALLDDAGRPLRYPADRPSRDETRAAQEAAQKLYAKLIDGRTLAPTERVLTTYRLDELGALWLASIETPRNKKSVDVKGTYVRHWIAFAGDEALLPGGGPRWTDKQTPIERLVSDAGPEDYALFRLGRAIRKTVRKEISSLFTFMQWAKTRKFLASLPPRPVLPKGEAGVRTGKQRANPVHIDPPEARAIIDALPEYSDAIRSTRKGYADRAFRVRDVFDFMWEMTWRPSTLAKLAVPRNWSPGRATVTLHDADDKALYGREVTLTARARAILERCAPELGLVFGEHDYRDYIKAAALKVLPREKALEFARYDFRHGRINDLLESTGNMLGTAYVAGHKQLTTTNSYLRAQKRQGDEVIGAVNAAAALGDRSELGGTIPSPEESGTAEAPVTDENLSASQSGREDSNLRPLDPQDGPTAQDAGTIDGSAASVDGPRPENPLDRRRIRSPFGHTLSPAVDEAQRALAVEAAVWAAFDAFAWAATEDGEGDR